VLTIDFARLGLAPGMLVLDAGCGQGRHSLEALRRGCRLVALDLALDDLRHTRFLLRSLAAPAAPPAPATPGREFARLLDAAEAPAPPPAVPPAPPPDVPPPYMAVRADTLALPFPAATFERVLCSEVLEHVADPAAATAELARIVKPGGLFAVSVPTPFTEWAFRFGSDDYFNTPGGHVRIFTAQDVMDLLEDHGLTVCDVHFEHAFHSLYWWVRCVFGLHDERHPAIAHFRRVLTHVMFSRPLTRAEHAFDWLIPKSMVIYGVKG
jgi:SAM-dependent methyltransferase